MVAALEAAASRAAALEAAAPGAAASAAPGHLLRLLHHFRRYVSVSASELPKESWNFRNPASFPPLSRAKRLAPTILQSL